jgi:hypothetical protein
MNGAGHNVPNRVEAVILRLGAFCRAEGSQPTAFEARMFCHRKRAKNKKKPSRREVAPGRFFCALAKTLIAKSA